MRHLYQELSQVGRLVIKRQQFLAHHGRIKSTNRHQFNQVIHGDQWQPVLGGTGHGSQLSLYKVAYQLHQRLTVKDMPRAAVATHRRRVDNGDLPALGGHDLQGRKMRLQLAPLVTTDVPVDGRPIRQLRITRINPDALQMFMIFQHVAADHH